LTNKNISTNFLHQNNLLLFLNYLNNIKHLQQLDLLLKHEEIRTLFLLHL